jgi:hypothetical protein
MSLRSLAFCLTLTAASCGKPAAPAPEAAPTPAAAPEPVPTSPVPVAAPVAASPTEVAPSLPPKPTATVEDGTVILRGRGDKGLYGVEVRFRQPQVGALFTAMTKVTDLTTGAAVPDAKLILDATMPEHRHGMMTRPVHTEISPGAWRSEGMKLHMAGHWVIDATVDAGGKQDTVHIPWEQPSL